MSAVTLRVFLAVFGSAVLIAVGVALYLRSGIYLWLIGGLISAGLSTLMLFSVKPRAGPNSKASPSVRGDNVH